MNDERYTPGPSEPVVRERKSGGWVALSHADDPLRIAVVGESEQEARDAFADSARWWSEGAQP